MVICPTKRTSFQLTSARTTDRMATHKMRLPLQLWIMLTFSTVCFGAVAQEEDNCPVGKHKILNEPYRSTGYDTRPSDTPTCDKSLKGWYRFIGVNGESADMPTTCPGSNACGTSTPIWMVGTFPKVSDGIVSRTLCGKVGKDANADCCEFTDEVFVKNCNGFYIYYLGKQSECPIGYCAGTVKRCPVGKWSNTGFEPCKDPGLFLDKPPTVAGVNVHSDKSFDYACNFEYADKDASNVFEVTWTFNGQRDASIPTEVLTGGQRSAILAGDKLKTHLDAEVGCQVVTYFKGQESKKNTHVSETKLFGVKNVELTGPRVDGGTTFKFECVVSPAPDDAEQKTEVVWTINGVVDTTIPSRILLGGKTIAPLDGTILKGHLNSVVGCQARLIYDKSDIKTAFRKSNTYFAGIQITPANLAISGSEGEKDITVTSTIPIVCEQSKACCLTFTLSVDNSAVVSLKNTCGYKLCTSDWNAVTKQASLTITVVPARNAISAGTRNAVLSFGEATISSIGPYNEVFKGFTPKPVPIVITLEAGYTCFMTGDPHFYGFDYKVLFDLYQIGDYTAVDIKERDFKVQFRTWQCWSVTCICGIVVKEKNDIIKVFGCDKPDLVYSTLETPYTLSSGVSVQRSGDGRRIGIVLASGSEVKIEMASYYMNIYVNLPATDKGKAVGICGTNDGNAANDFTKPDGTVNPVCSGWGRCIPVEFTESWRVNGEASMLQLTPEKITPPPPTEFCSCSTNTKGKPVYTCSAKQKKSDITCPNCQEVTKDLEPATWGEKDQAPEKFPTLPAVNPNKKWPNDKGVTEAQARDLCTKAIQKSPVYNQCKNVDTVAKSATDECMGDILFGGTTDALNAVTASFTTKCQVNLAKDEKNYDRGPDGSSKLKPDVTDLICPLECSEHGKCQAGKCVCNAGWAGETCLIDLAKGPQISYVPGRKGCTTRTNTCDTAVFDKSNVNIHDKLKCRAQKVNDKGEKIGQPVVTDTLSMSSSRVVCPLPKTGANTDVFTGGKGERYTFSISTDGTKFGNELLVIAIPDSCLDCSETTCKEKANVCIMKGYCYADGEVNKKNTKEKCDVQTSTVRWSRNGK